MRHLHLSSSIIIMPSSSSSRRRPASPNPSTSTSRDSPPACQHSPSAILDLLILILVLISASYLIFSLSSYVYHCLSLILPPLSLVTIQDFYYKLSYDPQSQFIFVSLFLGTFIAFIGVVEFFCGHWTRKCGRNGCKGLKRRLEFDLLLQGEELLRMGDESEDVRNVNELPWKGGNKDDPEYEFLRAELRKMSPPNGRAVLVFCDSCGCPTSKLEGWAPKRGRRHKKGLTLAAGGGDRH